MDATTAELDASTMFINDTTASIEPWTEITSPVSRIEPYFEVILSLTVGFTSLATVIGNAIVIYAFITTHALRTYTNYFVLNLAILDLIGGVFPMPMYGTYWILGYWPFGTPMCDFYMWVNHTTLNATSYAILIIAIDRYRSVVHPIKHFQQRNWRYAALWMSFCYAISLLIWTPAIFIWPAIGGRTFPPHICQPEYTNNFAFAVFAQLEIFWIPAVTMAVLYSKIYRVYKERMGTRKYKNRTNMSDIQSREGDSGISISQNTLNTDLSSTIGSDGPSDTTSDRQFETRRMRQENNRAVRTLTFIFVVYLTSGIPWAILVIIFKMCPTCFPLVLYQTTVYLARISSLLNPACYAAANVLYKDAFVRILCFLRVRRK